MLREIDAFFDRSPEPLKGCLQALRYFVLAFDPRVTEVWRYSMPFYLLAGKRLCYIWVEKKSGKPYLGIVNGNLLNHPQLVADKRSRMKIITLDPNEDLPLGVLHEILELAARLSEPI